MDFYAKKRFGQNFLVNPQMQKKVIDKMRDFCEKYDYNIIEVGPGKGYLTGYILTFGKDLKAFEIDPEAVEFLEKQFSDIENLYLYNQDFLEILGKQDFEEKFILLSNLPFNVGSRILVDLAIYYPKTPFVVILQKEVARKVRKNEDFTFFGAWLNLFWNTKVEFSISPGNFSPPPKVYSALMSAEPKELRITNYELKIEDRAKLKNILKSLFANPKKTLTNNLKNLKWDSRLIASFFKNNNLDPKLRLNWENYEGLLSQIYEVECSRNK